MRRSCLLILAVAAASCTGTNSARDAGDLTRSLVRVEVSYTHLAGAADLRFDAQAHFVRYRSFDPAGVPTILGFVDYDAIGLDSCRATDGASEVDAALVAQNGLVPAEVALLDAGRIELRGPAASGDRSIIRAKRYPELVPFVSGVVYGGEDTQPVALALGQPYQVAGDGGEEVGPFLAQAAAPHAFPSLSLEPLRHAQELYVRWAGGSDSSTEPLLLEVKWTSRAGSRAVRCRVRDDGEFAVPASAFESLPPGAAATVSATRVSRGPIDAPGVGHGELSVALRDVAPLQVQP
ncbi:MAG TPA: hypothetical protein VFF06_06900 [Polyangia bacterium]|nr:hypothetical protein [Polyangia bacterium]